MSNTIRLEIMLRTDKSEAEYAGALAEVYAHLMTSGLFVTDFRLSTGTEAEKPKNDDRPNSEDYKPDFVPPSWTLRRQFEAFSSLMEWLRSIPMSSAQFSGAIKFGASEFSRLNSLKNCLTLRQNIRLVKFLKSRADVPADVLSLFEKMLEK